MPRGVKKEHLPVKVCVTCQRLFTWRKKWESCWDEVTTCSKSCNRQRRQQKQASSGSDNNIGSEEAMSSFEPDHGPQGRADSLQDELVARFDHQTRFGSYDEQSIRLYESDDDPSERFAESDYTDRPVPKAPMDEDNDTANNDAAVDESNPKGARKAAKQRMKAERRAQREGRGDPQAGRKTCDVCGRLVHLLVRCRIDQTMEWNMVCGSCWHDVSGGVVDGDTQHPYYQYGGLWKNRRAQPNK